jgi:hypothetical protein
MAFKSENQVGRSMSNSSSKGTALITAPLGASELFIPSKCFIFQTHFPTYSQTQDRKELNEGIACIHSNDRSLQSDPRRCSNPQRVRPRNYEHNLSRQD